MIQNVTILQKDKLQFYLAITLQQPQKISQSYMLGQNAAITNLKSKSESLIRHQVRKLRAKVKALIPQQMCTHYQKRNQHMQKISQRRSQYLNHHHIVQHTQSNNNFQQNNKIKNQRWKYGSQKLQQLHINNTKNKINDGIKNCQFDKLTSEQIQQINQDKIYYLGQANVQSYNYYLKYLKNKGLEHIQSRSELKTNFGGNQNVINIQDINMKQYYSVSLLERKHNQKNIKNKLASPPKIFYNNIISQSNSTAFIVGKSRMNRNSTTSINKWNTDGHLPSQTKNQHRINQILQKKQGKNLKNINHKPLQKRKQQIQHQLKQKRLYQKLKIDMQMAKADANQRQIKYKQYSKIKQNRNRQKIKQQQVIKRKNILLKKGEIIKINQQLRNIMLQRRNNNQNFGRSNSCVINYQSITQSC